MCNGILVFCSPTGRKVTSRSYFWEF